MPAKSEKQLAHLVRINTLAQTVANRFVPKHTHYLGRVNGQSTYKAPDCEHTTTNPFGRRCRVCYQKSLFKNGPAGLRPDGYRLFNQSGKQLLMHRVIAEQALGRPLTKDECVHHINMNRSDNRPENLLICSRAYNTWLVKRYAELYAKEHFNS